jgi:hypothetical protein
MGSFEFGKMRSDQEFTMQMTLAAHRGDVTYWFVPRGQTDPAQALYPLDARQSPPRGGPASVDEHIEVNRLTIASEQDALVILQPLAVDSLIMPEFRRMAGALGLSNLTNRKDSEVLHYLALQSLVQRLFVIRRVILHSGTSSDEDQEPAERPEAAAEKARRDNTAEPDPPTFGPDVLQDQQAGGLIAASADGVPFCEECARLAAEKAA